MSHTGKKDVAPTGDKSDNKPKKATRVPTSGANHGAYDVHPVSGKLQRADHGTAYPGVELPTQAGPVASGPAESPLNPAALEEGLANSMGDSASGVHKGLPSSKHPAAQPGVTSPRGTKYSDKTGDAAREEGLSKEGFRRAK